MRRVIPTLLAASAMSLHAASVRIADFGGADTSAANTFWNVSGYNGVTVCRAESSAVTGFDSRSRMRKASRGIPIRTEKAGGILVVR